MFKQRIRKGTLTMYFIIFAVLLDAYISNIISDVLAVIVFIATTSTYKVINRDK